MSRDLSLLYFRVLDEHDMVDGVCRLQCLDENFFTTESVQYDFYIWIFLDFFFWNFLDLFVRHQYVFDIRSSTFVFFLRISV